MLKLLCSLLVFVAVAAADSPYDPHQLPDLVTLFDTVAVDDQDTTLSTAFRIGDYSEFAFQLYAVENTGSAHIKILYGISYETGERTAADVDASLFSYVDAAGTEQVVTDCDDFTQTARANTYIAPPYGVWCRLMAVGLGTNGSDIDLYGIACKRRGL